MKTHEEILEYMEKHQSYEYAAKVVDGTYDSGYYVTKTCQNFLDDLHDSESPYYMDIDQVELISNLLKLINFGSGLLAGKPIYEGLAGFQWFFIVSILGWKHKDDPEKRRYEKSVLLIARKSGIDLPPLIAISLKNWAKSVKVSII